VIFSKRRALFDRGDLLRTSEKAYYIRVVKY